MAAMAITAKSPTMAWSARTGPAAAAYGPGRYGYGGYASPSAMPAPLYGAGYSGGYALYQQMYYQRLNLGLGF